MERIEKNIRAIVFDADNTLYDTKKVAKSAGMAALRVAARLAKSDVEVLYSIWKGIVESVKDSKDPDRRSRLYSYRILLKRLGIKDGKVLDAMHKRFMQVLTGSIKLKGAVKETLMRLKGRFELFVISEDGKVLLDEKFRKLGIRRYFSLIISSDDVKTMKPSMKYYSLLRHRTGIDYNRFLAVGDSFEKDLKIPKELGMTTVLIGGKNSDADYCIKSIKELTRILKLR